jgi:hypothetical protein
MAIRSGSTDEQFVLRQVVSEIRWLLAHSGGVRDDLIRLVCRYEDALYGPSLSGRSGEVPDRARVTAARILPFPQPRSSGDSIAPPTNIPRDPA